jgi:PAS domain S-box-containing protein
VAGNPIIFANDSLLSLAGYDRDEVLGQNFNFLLAWCEDEKAIRQIEQAFAKESEDIPKIHSARENDSEFWTDVFVSQVKDDNGAMVQHFVSFADTKLYRLAQRNAAMLIDELNHRVKNTLVTVLSIVTQAIRNTSDLTTVKEAIETRIAALSRSHDLLSREKLDGAGLSDLVREELAPFTVIEGHADRFTISGENIRLSPKPRWL